MENLRLWDQVARPPKTALRKIEAGRLRGKTDISPQWRIKAMTEVFGPVGIGWRYEVVRFWTEQGEKELMAFCLLNLWYKDGDQWSEPVPGVGGSMLTAQEKSGAHNSDEAFKMAMTDALSVAMKALGVAADIYMGKWDGVQYDTSSPADLLSFDDATNYPALIVAIESCSTMEELRDVFKREIDALGTDNIGRAVLGKLKDKKKREIANG